MGGGGWGQVSHLHVRALVFRERTGMVTCRRSSSRHPVPSNPERCRLPKREKLSTPHPSLAAFLLKHPIHGKERYMPFLAAVTPPFLGRCSPFCVHQTTTRNEESSFVHFPLPPFTRLAHHLPCSHLHTEQGDGTCCGL